MGRGKSRNNLTLIRVANDILAEIQPASVRAVCYQLFTRKLIPSMDKTHTNRVSTQLRDAREEGVIPWDWIVDETRAVRDWDCSGLHMSEVDLPQRLARYGADITIRRVALTKAHVSTGDLPWFSADEKKRDSRYRWYVKHHGRHCWELDALSPVLLQDAVESAIREYLDVIAWNQAERAERAERESLATILDAWPGISRQAQKYSTDDGVTHGDE